MNALLKFSGLIDGLSERVGRAAIWLILIVVIISAGNAVSRFSLNLSSNAMLEVQWYLFSAVFLFCAAYVLKKNEHIRIDVIAGRLSERGQNWIDVFGIIVFLLPMAALITWTSWSVFMNAWNSGEMSSNPGGLIRWPVRLMLPAGFVLLILQALSELIKRVAFLTGAGPNPLAKEAGPSAEEELAEAIKKHQVAPEVADIVGMNREMVNGKEGEPK
ncbi:TRAP-type mannitol/chloroaromatic compound transport system permease small subunit [Sulfurisoma sediminicola]|uniref:TRAP transporter small permease protein n=2 Tax=Sulfurisoma sediminicola TaxID=1381557 RepID=A0A497XN29_9PROT|nr:TRAP-type mannitol/chloroaromatic compound transport system permease small subunit [Sulfurisoma sediminicola]